MDFKQYVALTSDSAASAGYDAFLPSICNVGDQIKMNVLQTELTASGDEDIAKEWALEFISDHSTVYLAFRSGDRTITVLEIDGTEVIRKEALKMRPFDG